MFRVFEEEVEVEAGQSYFAYGIEACGQEWRVGQISVVREEVEQLALRMNTNDLSPVHLQDVAEDWLTDK